MSAEQTLTRSDRSNEEDETKHTHINHEVGKRVCKSRIRQRFALSGGWVVRLCGSIEWLKRAAKGQPEGTKHGEDNRRERVSEDELLKVTAFTD
jgi:hypothetical protein